MSRYAIEIRTAYEMGGKRRMDKTWARVALRDTQREAESALRDWLRDRPEGSKGRIVEAGARSRLVPIRMTPEEIETLTAAAKERGLGLGPWLRMLGLREAGSSPTRPRR